MNAVFKSVLFVGIIACGLYGCGQIFTGPKPVENETNWEFVSSAEPERPDQGTALASHEEPTDTQGNPLRRFGQAKQALFESPEEFAAPKIRSLPSVDSSIPDTASAITASAATQPAKLPMVRNLPVVRDLPDATEQTTTASSPRIASLPKVVDASASSPSAPLTDLSGARDPASFAGTDQGRETGEHDEPIRNPFVVTQRSQPSNGFSTSSLPGVEQQQETIGQLPADNTLVSEQADAAIGNLEVPTNNAADGEWAGDVSQHVKNRFFDPNHVKPESAMAHQADETGKIKNEFAGQDRDSLVDDSASPTMDSPDVADPTNGEVQAEDFQSAMKKGAAEIQKPAPSLPADLSSAIADRAAAPTEPATDTAATAEPVAKTAAWPATPARSGEFQPEPQQVLNSVVARPTETPTPIIEQPSRAPLSTAVAEAEASPQQELPSLTASLVVEERALQHIIYGKSLARRGSVFAARQEFMQALRLITESYDMQSRTRAYTKKLAVGLRALTESDDFVAIDTEQQMNMDLRGILDTHGTRVIDAAEAAEISPIQAMQTYYAYSAEQLSQAIGQSVVASDALHALGKLLTTTARFDASGKPQDRTKSMVMHQVALHANPANHLSANELGVLLASNGRWQQALDLFSQSLRIQPTAATWKNLATAHEQLAIRLDDPEQQRQQQQLAQLAIREFRTLSASELVAETAVPQDWATPQEFGDQAAMPEVHEPAQVASAPEEQQPETKSAGRGLLKNMKDWF